MKKMPFAFLGALLTSAVVHAAPIANAPLATPVLVDSTGKVMGRYIDMNLLVTINGDVVALPLRPRTAYIVDGVEGRGFAEDSRYVVGPFNRSGLDWQEGNVYVANNTLANCDMMIGNQGSVIDLSKSKRAVAFYPAPIVVFLKPSLPLVPAMSRVNVAIFGVHKIGSRDPQVMYASLSNSPAVSAGSGAYVTLTTVQSGASYCTSVGNERPALAPETSLINLDQIGIAPFFVQ